MYVCMYVCMCVLKSFPIPNLNSTQNDLSNEVMLEEIERKLRMIKSEIQPDFSRRIKKTYGVREVTQEKLADLWNTNRARAIAIIKDDCKIRPQESCSIQVSELQECFESKCKSKLESEFTQETPWPKEIEPSQPQSLPSTEPFTIQEVVNAIKNLPSRKAAGQDRLKYEHLKRNLNTIKISLMNIFNTCFVNKKIPKQWKESVSILLLKRDENNKPKDSTNIKNWREIGLSVTLYKVYMMLIKNRLLPWMFERERLSPRQKGGSPRKGLQEHVFCFKTAIEDFKHESGKLHVIFFDIIDAFGSLEHKIMLQEMEKLGIPQHYTEIIKDAYNGPTFKVRTSDGETKPINRERGIIQGCLWSVYGFLIGIDKWIRWLDDPNQTVTRPTAVQGYVDDVGAMATNMQGAQQVVQRTEQFTNYARVEVKAPKCETTGTKRKQARRRI